MFLKKNACGTNQGTFKKIFFIDIYIHFTRRILFLLGLLIFLNGWSQQNFGKTLIQKDVFITF